MIQAFLIIFFFTAAFTIKGGPGYILKNWDYVRDKNPLLDRVLDGKVLSTLLVWLLVVAITANGFTATLWAAGWLLSVAPSLGEEHGAVGRLKHAWGQYIEWMPEKRDFSLFGRHLFTYTYGRSYGIKKAIQRGVWGGACMAAFTGHIPFIFASLLYVPAVFIGQEITYRITGKNGWSYAEPIIGAAVFGLPAVYCLY